ncbi:MAG TPA: c-type cytochrome biogenesis protein CcsB [Candidatus Limnocylindrales bacterium]|nr:c-type cytochrome biogenesis protein CcsB [Candidatus Limnocylindrales bacterium]
MAFMHFAAFDAALVLLGLGFTFHVAHTTLLAHGRGALAAVRARGPRLAAAGAGTGVAIEVGGRPRHTTAQFGATAETLPGGTRSGGLALGLTWGAAIALAMSLLFRALVVGRGPWGNMFEFSIAFAFGIVAGYLVLERRYPIRSLGFLPLSAALFLAAYAKTLPGDIAPLVPALENRPLLTLHVAMAMISYGIFATSFGAAVGYLAQGGGPTERFAWLPSRKVLDEVAYRAVIIGFPIFATLIILGSWWASIAWGRYWGWDPKETSALVTWLIYAVYLHARNQRGWAGRPAALILVVGFGAVLFTYFGNLFFSGLHAYSGL